jgi:hypothetical protein
MTDPGIGLNNENCMRRILNKAKNHRDAEEWDIQQQVSMSPEERQKVALELKRRVCGRRVPDVRGK